ncbi:hypothetical protein EVAR_39234_1 [Eumeta japonica]|uniref:Uncharacterized protein n=1 Tax=Eumeta variegata TaxID=151549 RepID=A0A4C1VQD5_EUMVA|nr:hypothetical protein EVAR_39234_1 [Eumeta japonica]
MRLFGTERSGRAPHDATSAAALNENIALLARVSVPFAVTSTLSWSQLGKCIVAKRNMTIGTLLSMSKVRRFLMLLCMHSDLLRRKDPKTTDTISTYLQKPDISKRVGRDQSTVAAMPPAIRLSALAVAELEPRIAPRAK